MSKSAHPAKKTLKDQHPMNQACIEKITVNIGVGEAGERLQKAQTVLENITHQKPVQTLSKKTNKDFGTRKRMPLGCKVTLRGERADSFLKQALDTRENKLADYSIDDQGNFSFGIPDHTLFKDQKYNPDIGIFGMDICVTMGKPGYRIKHRRIQTRKIKHPHHLQREETKQFVTKQFNVEVVE
jgi:large subunit ribosomal protein L5